MIHVNVGSPAGTYSVGSSAFFRYVVRLSDVGLPLRPADRDATDMLSAIPNANVDEDEYSGNGWRVVPASSYEDWPVLEATPARLGGARPPAPRSWWHPAPPAGITAREISTIDDEIENVLSVLARAEAAGFSVNVSYAS
jgi:hypothetical protein